MTSPVESDAWPTFDRDTLPDSAFPYYARRVTATRALRIRGPFAVETLEGRMVCKDGWLALDVAGNPYPIDVEVFAKTFEARPL